MIFSVVVVVEVFFLVEVSDVEVEVMLEGLIVLMIGLKIWLKYCLRLFFCIVMILLRRLIDVCLVGISFFLSSLVSDLMMEGVRVVRLV